MKKRVLSLCMAFVLSFSMMPMTAFAQGTDAVTEQEAQSRENAADAYAMDEDISGGNAGTQGVEKTIAVQAVQELIDALPEEVTAENVETIKAQLKAIDEAMEHLTTLDETLINTLNTTRYENLCEALNKLVAVQAGNQEHSDSANHGIAGINNWKDIDALDNINSPGGYYLTKDVVLTSTWKPADHVVLCLNGHKITMDNDTDVIQIITKKKFYLCDCTGNGTVTHGTKDSGEKYTGSGVKVENGATFNMTGGTITGNTAENGGGVSMDGGTFNMIGAASISNNIAKTNGGGVYMGSPCTFIMSGNATISSNTVTNGRGGGVCAMKGDGLPKTYKFTMSDNAKIKDNTATTSGGGVDFDGSGKLEMVVSGAPIIQGNSVNNKVSNVCLNGSSITIGSAGLTIGEKGASIGVTTSVIPDEITSVGIVLGATQDDYITCFTPDAGSKYQITRDSSINELVLRLKPHEHYFCGGESCNGQGHTETDKVSFTKWDSTNSLPSAEGNYYLTEDVVLNGTWTLQSNVNLCLNGHSITANGDFDVITVPSSCTLNLSNCETTGQITHARGKKGSGIVVDGTFTMYGGGISGNTTATSNNGGGVLVKGNGKFEMTGGTISTNSAEDNGGGVYVAGGVFEMTGGTISNNNAGQQGGGVYTAAADTFKMAGGTISNNTAQIVGGGVGGKLFTMTGGTITGNISGNDGGGGVHSSYGIKLSGAPVIIGNKRRDNTESNVFATRTDCIQVEGALEAGAKIGVITDSGLGNNKVKFAINAPEGVDYNSIFTSDVNASIYEVTRDANGNLYFGKHEHSWNYALKTGSTDTIVATCTNATGKCSNPNGGSVTINSPAHVTYGDGNVAEATLAKDNWVADAVDATQITYKNGDTTLNAAPTDAGTYTAGITVGDVTASVIYVIEKATPAAGNFNFTPPQNPIYDGTPKTATVATKTDISGMGAVTVKYYKDGKEVSQPTDAGTYHVKISVTEGTNYTAASDLTDNWSFTITANNATPNVELSGDRTYTGKQITPDVKVTVGNTVLTKGTDYDVTYGDNMNAGTDTGTVIIKAKGNYAFAAITQKFTIERANPKLSFKESILTITYGDMAENVLVNEGDGTVTYTSSNESVAKFENGKLISCGVGETTITANSTATQNYESGTASYMLRVNKALIHITAANISEKIYDGNTDARVTEVSFANAKNEPMNLASGNYTATGTFLSANAGDGKVTVHVTLSNDFAKNYELTSETFTATAKIMPMSIRINGVTAVRRSYRPNDTSVSITGITFLNNAGDPVQLTEDADYIVTGEMENADAGSDKPVIVTVTLQNDAANNYKFMNDDHTATTQVTIDKAAGDSLPVYNFHQKFTDLTERTCIPDYSGLPVGEKWKFSGVLTDTTGTVGMESFTMNPATGVLTYKLSAGEKGDTVKWTVTISGQNYEDFTQELLLTLTEKEDQAPLIIAGDTTVVYGQKLTLGTTGGSGTGAVTYRIDEAVSDGEATIDADGVLTPVKVGTVTVVATKASDSDYNEVTSNPFVITITRATSTGEPRYSGINTDGKTLADAGLTLTGSSLNPTAGTLEWIDDAGNVLPDETRVEANRIYKWRFTPVDNNYTVLTGEIKLYLTYSIIDGANSSWTQSTDGSGSIRIRGNGEISKFRNVKVDGTIVDPANYTVTEGSTIIELKADYLKTLAAGTHTFEIVWTNGTASTSFTVAKNTPDEPENDDNNKDDNNDNNGNDNSNDSSNNGSNNTAGNDNTVQILTGSPNTGDASGIWITLFVVSAAGLAVMLVRKKNNIKK